jgi:hypothetical protein
MKTTVVAAPLCSPARDWLTKVEQQLGAYGAARAGLRVAVREVDRQYMRIEVSVSDDYAAWCEYLLLRLGYQRIGALLNPKNQVWAQRYLDLAAAGACWQQPGCKTKLKGATAGELVVSAPPPAWADQSDARRGRPAAREPGWLGWLKELL